MRKIQHLKLVVSHKFRSLKQMLRLINNLNKIYYKNFGRKPISFIFHDFSFLNFTKKSVFYLSAADKQLCSGNYVPRRAIFVLSDTWLITSCLFEEIYFRFKTYLQKFLSRVRSWNSLKESIIFVSLSFPLYECFSTVIFV